MFRCVVLCACAYRARYHNRRCIARGNIAGAAAAPRWQLPGRLRLQFPTAQLPPTSGAQSVDINGDGITCVNLIAFSNPHGTRFAAVDNVVPPRPSRHSRSISNSQ